MSESLEQRVTRLERIGGYNAIDRYILTLPDESVLLEHYIANDFLGRVHTSKYHDKLAPLVGLPWDKALLEIANLGFEYTIQFIGAK